MTRFLKYFLEDNGFDENNLNSWDKNRFYTPLLLAVEDSDIEIIDELVKLGADVNVKDDNGKTALMDAAHEGEIDVVETLIKYNVDVSLTDRSGFSALHASVLSKNKDVVKVILEKCSEESINKIWEDFFKTPLDIAVENKAGEIIELLESKGAKVAEEVV